MQIIQCEQGSNKWLLARLGRPTASRFGDIVTTTGKPSKAAARDKYLWQLVGERLTGRTTEHFESDAMRRGTALEPIARDWYSMQTGNKVEQIGFVYALDGRTGGSPDGLIGDDGAIEIKALLLHNHIAAIADDELCSAHYMQAQGVMWVTDRRWLDFVHFTDAQGVPSRYLRIERDDKLTAALEEHIGAFCDDLDAAEAKIRERYELPERKAVDIDKASGDWCPWPDAPIENSEKETGEQTKQEAGNDDRNSIDGIGQRANRNGNDSAECAGSATKGREGANRLF